MCMGRGSLQKSEREKPHSGETTQHASTQTPCNQPAITSVTRVQTQHTLTAQPAQPLTARLGDVPTARSSADPTEPNHTPTRYTRAKDKMILQMVKPQAASSQRTHAARTQPEGRARTHPVTRRVTTQYLHTQSVTTRRSCGRNDTHEAPSEL